MLRIQSSTAATENSLWKYRKRQGGGRGAGGEDNVSWLGRQLESGELRRPLANGEEPTLCLLLGARGPYGFRLRGAQAHMRHDLTPSHWSHAALFSPGDEGWPASLADMPLAEISLEPRGGFGFPPPKNCLQEGKLGDYRSRRWYPNVALLRLPVARAAWQQPPAGEGQQSVLKRYREQRAVLDGTQLVLEWLGFVWGVGKVGNPLLDGHGVPSAAMIEIVLAAAGFDVTPGIESRASSPEAIWQAAKWWHKFYQDQNREAVETVCVIEDKLGEDWEGYPPATLQGRSPSPRPRAGRAKARRG